jgi:hypothetical protein
MAGRVSGDAATLGSRRRAHEYQVDEKRVAEKRVNEKTRMDP